MLLVINNTGRSPGDRQSVALAALQRFLDELGVPHTDISTADDVRAHASNPAVTGIVLTGSDASLAECVDAGIVGRASAMLRRCRVPVLGICFGHQLLALLHGGEVRRMPMGERVGTEHVYCGGEGNPWVPSGAYYFRHGDAVTHAPPGWTVDAVDAAGAVQVMRDPARPVVGVQFHPELSGAAGGAVLRRFLAWAGLQPQH